MQTPILINIILFLFFNSSFLSSGPIIDLVNKNYFSSGQTLTRIEDTSDFIFNHLPKILKTAQLTDGGEGGQTAPTASIVVPEKKNNEEKIEVSAQAAAVIDYTTSALLFDTNADKPWPIASITKLVTALVFLDHNPGWDNVYQITNDDRREGGKIYLFIGEKVKIKDLFYLSLVGSANTATVALVHSTGMSEDGFVDKMNEKVKKMGLKNTVFYDPTGLTKDNLSTAKEVARFSKIALLKKDIREATLTKKYEFETLAGRKKIVYNTDDLLEIFMPNGVRIMGGKTGFNESSGYCFVGQFINQDNKKIISVVLGEATPNGRFDQAHVLTDWAYKNYTW